MAAERRRQIVLGAVLVVLGLTLYRAWTSTSDVPASSSNARTRATRATGAAPTPTAPDVRLQALEGERPGPGESERNLFTFGSRPMPAPPPVATPPVARPTPGGLPRPAAASTTIPLKFIGIVEAPAQSKRIAALVDSTGLTFHGSEGDVVAGQYRILKIGVESIEMAYLDGRGRQTIRLSGS